jgi:transcriptional regulator with AbiEi antitoxin domain of type IV toxin-antitoxin system
MESGGWRVDGAGLDLATPWGCSSAGRAPHWQCGGHGFESRQLHFLRKPRATCADWRVTLAGCLTFQSIIARNVKHHRMFASRPSRVGSTGSSPRGNYARSACRRRQCGIASLLGGFTPSIAGVYVVGHRQLSQNGRFLAPVAAVGGSAVLSHMGAAALWGLTGSASPGEIGVAVARSVRPRPGIRLHVVRSLPDRDRARRAGVPVTTPARTLLDLAGVCRRARACPRGSRGGGPGHRHERRTS